MEKERHRQLAVTDKLTNIKNRNGLYEYAENKLIKSLNADKPVIIAMCDIDKFKSFNDTYGHDAGDIVLQHVAKILKDNVRLQDGVFRYGGEEFVLILNGIEKAEAYDIAEQIRSIVENTPCDIGNGKTANATISIGLEQVAAQRANKSNIYSLIDNAKSQADKLLYVAKETGRNKVVFNKSEMLDKSAPKQEKPPDIAGLEMSENKGKFTASELDDYQESALDFINKFKNFGNERT